MIEEEAARWAVRIDRGLSHEEQAALDAWVSGDNRKQGALLRARAAWSVLDRARALGTEVEEEVVEDEEPADAPQWSRRNLLRLGGGFGATLALAGGLVWRLWPRGEEFATTTGEIRRLPLEDGSLAMVNSASGIRVAFSANRRDIELSHGEAWFKVAKNKVRPFTVVAGPTYVQAVGTAFDVRRYPDASEVVVTEGVVKIWSNGAGGEPTLVKAGHRAMIGDRSGIMVTPLSAAGVDQQLAWREGRIILDDMSLGAAAQEFNRYNDTKLVVDPMLAGERMVGWFRVDDVEGFVKATSTLVGGRVVRDSKTIRIINNRSTD